ncbi:hypothetical protein GUJ93_ZPchr0001g32602 [Zizania palustris]|uniref:Uncharacterized protein n=1 Tax=Zizania palustris TaxID=103762 RepID=A0A8J5VDE9_ZIZPA|nr:hypothetical protein GUJ93_ZPchr0001g32602 [Zizania palustris]
MASSRVSCIVLFLALVIVVAAGLVAAEPADARAVAEYTAPPADATTDVVAGGGARSFGAIGGRRWGRWNARSLQGGKREVPGGPDPQHHY